MRDNKNSKTFFKTFKIIIISVLNYYFIHQIQKPFLAFLREFIIVKNIFI